MQELGICFLSRMLSPTHRLIPLYSSHGFALGCRAPPMSPASQKATSAGAALIISLDSCAFSESRAAKMYNVHEWPDGHQANQCPGWLHDLMSMEKSIFISEQTDR